MKIIIPEDQILEGADKLALMYPDEFKKFLSHCKRWGINGALNAYHVSEEFGIIHAWALKISKEHPEIER